MTSPIVLELVERLNVLLDRMIRQSERMDNILSDMEQRQNELRRSNN